jgi:hypothetical protein
MRFSNIRTVVTLALAAGVLAGALYTPQASGYANPDAFRAGPKPESAGADLYDVRVNQVTVADQHEPTLAVNPVNPDNLIAAAKDWRTGPKQVWYYRSTDGGRTWADGHLQSLPTELPNQSDPVITFDASGTAYFAFIDYNQNDFSVGGIAVARSTDGGQSWGRPVLVSANTEDVFNDKEWIAVDRSRNPATRGNVYVTWTLFRRISPNRERGDIVISRSTDGGRTFSGPQVVSLPGQTDNQGSWPAIGPNGEVYVLYYNDTPTGEADALYVARSTDGGQSFPQVRRATSVRRPPSPLPGSQFRLFVLPAMAIDPRNGTLYVTWNDYRSGDSDVLLVSSTDGGQTWSSPQRVNDDPPMPRHDQFFPTIAAGSDGAVHVLWLDRRDDPANKRYAPYYARSTDGGRTFSPNIRIAGADSNPDIGFEGVLIGDYIALDVSSDGGRVFAAWVDTRGGDQDIYFSTFDAHTARGVGFTPGTPVVATATTTPALAPRPSPQPLTGFADEAFRRRWERADRPVLTGRANRPWLWGPVSFAAAIEPYAQSADGTRQVQYFDKARMEINHPNADRQAPGFVTNGLLVVEMISGRIQIGDGQFEAPRPPPQAPVAGDINSPNAITYASLAPVASLSGDKRSPDRTGQSITAVLDGTGLVYEDPSKRGQVWLVRYVPETGHNIPDVFWNFMNAIGEIYDSRSEQYTMGPVLDWVADLGYPITEPYWTYVQVGGVPRWVMVQAFQRRVLTYNPANPPGWQVEMGNVGRHYYDWRYGGQTVRR